MIGVPPRRREVVAWRDRLPMDCAPQTSAPKLEVFQDAADYSRRQPTTVLDVPCQGEAAGVARVVDLVSCSCHALSVGVRKCRSRPVFVEVPRRLQSPLQGFDSPRRLHGPWPVTSQVRGHLHRGEHTGRWRPGRTQRSRYVSSRHRLRRPKRSHGRARRPMWSSCRGTRPTRPRGDVEEGRSAGGDGEGRAALALRLVERGVGG